MTCPSYWKEAIQYLSTQDEILAKIITAYPDETLLNSHNPFQTLMKAVVGQQISVKAAAAIGQRLHSLLGEITPQQYLTASEDDLRQCGLSRQKISYLSHIAQAFINDQLTPQDWPSMSDEQVAQQLTAISGIGVWTSQMFLIFHLHRPDILPLSDVGLVKAVQQQYGQAEKTLLIRHRDNCSAMETLSNGRHLVFVAQSGSASHSILMQIMIDIQTLI